MADQLTVNAISWHGNAIVKTPHLDALAARSVVFDRNYCNSPICASSRSSMLTSKLPSDIGTYDNSSEFPASYPTIPHYLRALGYRTTLSGKMHFVGPDQTHGYERRLTTDIYPADFGWTVNWLKEEPIISPTGLNMRSIVEAGTCARSLQMDYDDDVAFNAKRELWDYARGEDDRPLFLTVSFTHPHNPFTAHPIYWNRYDHSAIDMPRVGMLPEDQWDGHTRRLHTFYRRFEWEVTDEHIRNARHAYYGMVSYIDDRVGELMETLAEAQLADDTIVIFTADHGEMLGERGLWYKFNFFEGSARVPLTVAMPGSKQQKRCGNLTSLADLLPTFLEMGNEGKLPPIASPIEGRSLLPLIQGHDPGRSDEVYAEFTSEGTIAPVVMIRRGDKKLIYCEADGAQLYDLAADPEELDNLASKPTHAKEVADFMKDVHRRWNLPEFKAKVIDSQQRRLFLHQVRLANVKAEPWDFQTWTDTSEQYVRSGSSPTRVKGRFRFPFVEPVSPDYPKSDMPI
jgi:choline-sulfatase